MTWFREWADEPYIDMTDGLLYLPQCTDSDCLSDPHGCLRTHAPDIDYAEAPRLALRRLEGRCTPIGVRRLFKHLDWRKVEQPERYIRMVLMARASQVRICTPVGPHAYETSGPMPPAVLHMPFFAEAPFVAEVVLKELLPPVCPNCGSFTA